MSKIYNDNYQGKNFNELLAVILNSNQQANITVTVSQQICESLYRVKGPVTEGSLDIQNIQLRWIQQILNKIRK